MDISAFIPIPKAFTEQIGPYITSQDAEMCICESQWVCQEQAEISEWF